METEQLEKYLGRADMTIVAAMQKIDKNRKKIIYIVDGERKLIGSLSDGDIRRWIIKTGEIGATIDKAMCQAPKCFFDDAVDEAKNFFAVNGAIDSLPILTRDGVLTDIIFRDVKSVYRVKKNFRPSLAGVPVIIMAGGKGTRLLPYTKILPKPLIPVGNIPIVERIINSFRECGADRFYMILNYKKEMIKSYFSEFKIDYEMNYVDEPEPLGTAGGIRIIDEQFDTPVIVTNCDILIRADYVDILQFHKNMGNALTIVSSLKHTVIPYGVIHSKAEGLVASMEEKPHVSYLVNTGMYVIDAEHLSKIPRDRVYNMTDFIDQLVAEDLKVGIYPVSEDSFLDMGEFEEMKRMEEKIYGNGMLGGN